MSPDPDTPQNAGASESEGLTSEQFRKKLRKAVIWSILATLVLAVAVYLIWLTPSGEEIRMHLDATGDVVPKSMFPHEGDVLVIEAGPDGLIFCVMPPDVFGGTTFEVPPNGELKLQVGLGTRGTNFSYGLYSKADRDACDLEALQPPGAVIALDLPAKGEGGGRTGP